MGLTGRDIICLSTHYWDERRFRKQEFMSRLTRENRVLYVEPSFSIANRPERHLRAVAANRPLVPRLERRGERLYLLKPPRGLPKWTRPGIEELTYKWYGTVVGRTARRLGFRDAVFWVYRPSWAYGLDRVPHRYVVFEVIDDLVAYERPGSVRAARTERAVLGLAKRSDLLVATASTLLERYGGYARSSVCVPNGFDALRFSPAEDGGRTPLELVGVPRPILGFVGTLFTHIDFALLEQVARRHEEKSVVLVGPVEQSARAAVEQLKRLPNVVHLGAQPQARIPSFVAAFDVCLNPFRPGKVADSVSPLKVYEYLALGRPVVSTPMAALQQESAGEVIAFADGPDAFAHAVEECLADRGDRAAARRRKAAAEYSWDALFATLSEACEEALRTP